MNEAVSLESSYVSFLVEGIDLVLPTVSNIKADITAVTNQDVVLTAEFADDVELKSSLYRIGETGEWKACPAGGVIVTENATVYFKAIDAAGNETTESYAVTNIQSASENVVSGRIVSAGESAFVSANTIYKDTTISGSSGLYSAPRPIITSSTLGKVSLILR